MPGAFLNVDVTIIHGIRGFSLAATHIFVALAIGNKVEYIMLLSVD